MAVWNAWDSLDNLYYDHYNSLFQQDYLKFWPIWKYEANDIFTEINTVKSLM